MTDTAATLRARHYRSYVVWNLPDSEGRRCACGADWGTCDTIRALDIAKDAEADADRLAAALTYIDTTDNGYRCLWCRAVIDIGTKHAEDCRFRVALDAHTARRKEGE